MHLSYAQNVDEFLLCRPYVWIWGPVVGRFNSTHLSRFYSQLEPFSHAMQFYFKKRVIEFKSQLSWAPESPTNSETLNRFWQIRHSTFSEKRERNKKGGTEENKERSKGKTSLVHHQYSSVFSLYFSNWPVVNPYW